MRGSTCCSEKAKSTKFKVAEGSSTIVGGTGIYTKVKDEPRISPVQQSSSINSAKSTKLWHVIDIQKWTIALRKRKNRAIQTTVRSSGDGTYLAEVMQDRGTASVSDARDVDPLVEQVVNGHLLLKLTRRAGTRIKVGLEVVVAHAASSAEHLQP